MTASPTTAVAWMSTRCSAVTPVESASAGATWTCSAGLMPSTQPQKLCTTADPGWRHSRATSHRTAHCSTQLSAAVVRRGCARSCRLIEVVNSRRSSVRQRASTVPSAGQSSPPGITRSRTHSQLVCTTGYLSHCCITTSCTT